MAVANDISVDAAMAAVLSELGGVFTFIEEHEKTALTAFPWWTTCFFVLVFLLPAVFRQTLQ